MKTAIHVLKVGCIILSSVIIGIETSNPIGWIALIIMLVLYAKDHPGYEW
jgi:hypothetical protein